MGVSLKTEKRRSHCPVFSFRPRVRRAEGLPGMTTEDLHGGERRSAPPASLPPLHGHPRSLFVFCFERDPHDLCSWPFQKAKMLRFPKTTAYPGGPYLCYSQYVNVFHPWVFHPWASPLGSLLNKDGEEQVPSLLGNALSHAGEAQDGACMHSWRTVTLKIRLWKPHGMFTSFRVPNCASRGVNEI